MVQGEIGIGQGLRLNALGAVHHKDGAVAGRQGAGNLIIEVHMSRGVDEIEDILLSVLRLVDDPRGLGLDRDAPLPLDIHIVQHLRLHFPLRQGAGQLNDPVRQRRLAVVNVGNDTKISDFALIDFCFFHLHSKFPSSLSMPNHTMAFRIFPPSAVPDPRISASARRFLCVFSGFFS